MTQVVPRDIAVHYQRVQSFQRDAVGAALAGWREVSPDRISESWRLLIPAVAVAVTSAQISAAESALIAHGDMAVATGQYRLPSAFVVPESFAGEGSTGEPLDEALYAPVFRAKEAIAGGITAVVALREARAHVERIVGSMVADAGRKAGAATMATRFTGGYVRMLNPPSCSRCAILAGRWYRWNDGFLRHPRCDCVHIPSKSGQWARDEGFVSDPYDYFNSMSEEEQNRFLGPSNAKAVRDGADIFQVTNAGRGRAKDGLTTTASTHKRRGIYRGDAPRLTPEGIYQRAGSKTEARKMLEECGYILPGGQDPKGVLRGDREGFGQLGRGGTRAGARWVVEEARRTGVRHPRARETMTAAERRRFDAELSWQAVREGRNPYGRGPLTDSGRRRAEHAYERFVLGMYGGDSTLTTAQRARFYGI